MSHGKGGGGGVSLSPHLHLPLWEAKCEIKCNGQTVNCPVTGGYWFSDYVAHNINKGPSWTKHHPPPHPTLQSRHRLWISALKRQSTHKNLFISKSFRFQNIETKNCNLKPSSTALQIKFHALHQAQPSNRTNSFKSIDWRHNQSFRKSINRDFAAPILISVY